MASAIGIVIGSGSYLTGAEATVVTLIALALFRRLEDRLPAPSFVHLQVGFARARTMDEDQFRQLIERHGFALRDLSYRLHGEPQLLEYSSVIWSNKAGSVRALEQSLLDKPEVVHFRISPSRD